jgi:hypothetical protein
MLYSPSPGWFQNKPALLLDGLPHHNRGLRVLGPAMRDEHSNDYVIARWPLDGDPDCV